MSNRFTRQLNNNIRVKGIFRFKYIYILFIIYYIIQERGDEDNGTIINKCFGCLINQVGIIIKLIRRTKNK